MGVRIKIPELPLEVSSIELLGSVIHKFPEIRPRDGKILKLFIEEELTSPVEFQETLVRGLGVRFLAMTPEDKEELRKKVASKG